MKIAVVCGGLSNERDVSITSGTCVARALRERGHKVVLVDLYYGYSGSYDDPAELFEREQEDVKYSVKEETPDIARILAEGDGSRIGKNVIEICKAADISFLALHGEDGENGKVQATFDRQRLPRQRNSHEQGDNQDHAARQRHPRSRGHSS